MTWATEKRRRQFDAEAEALGNPAKVGQHVPVGRGRRPYVKVSVTFSKVLTTRQREGRHGYMKLGRANGRIHEMARGEGRQMTMQEFVETLSPEELVRGRPRDKSGGFRGRPPTWVPHEFHRACIRELMRRGKEMWQVAYLEAIEAMTDIASGRGAAGKVATPGSASRRHSSSLSASRVGSRRSSRSKAISPGRSSWTASSRTSTTTRSTRVRKLCRTPSPRR
jgi:hypothetical protein